MAALWPRPPDRPRSIEAMPRLLRRLAPVCPKPVQRVPAIATSHRHGRRRWRRSRHLRGKRRPSQRCAVAMRTLIVPFVLFRSSPRCRPRHHPAPSSSRSRSKRVARAALRPDRPGTLAHRDPWHARFQRPFGRDRAGDEEIEIALARHRALEGNAVSGPSHRRRNSRRLRFASRNPYRRGCSTPANAGNRRPANRADECPSCRAIFRAA